GRGAGPARRHRQRPHQAHRRAGRRRRAPRPPAPAREILSPHNGTGVHLTDTDNVSIIINAHLTACNPDGDILAGDARSDAIAGGDGNDTLSGHGGNDLIEGGAGSDALSGGSGSNTFHYTNIADAGDTISKFKTGSGHDVLDIKDILSGFVDGVSDPNDFVQLTPSGGDTIVSVDADGTRGWQYL